MCDGTTAVDQECPKQMGHVVALPFHDCNFGFSCNSRELCSSEVEPEIHQGMVPLTFSKG